MTKEVRGFLIKLTIWDKSDEQKWKLVDLFKQKDIEIDWLTKNEGKVVDKDEINGKKGNIITFEKDDKKYQLLMNVKKIRKGWFKDEIVDYSFETLSEKIALYEPDFWRTDPLWLGGRTKKYHYDTIEPTQKRWSGFILVGSFFIVSVIVVIIIWFLGILWMIFLAVGTNFGGGCGIISAIGLIDTTNQNGFRTFVMIYHFSMVAVFLANALFMLVIVICMVVHAKMDGEKPNMPKAPEKTVEGEVGGMVRGAVVSTALGM